MIIPIQLRREVSAKVASTWEDNTEFIAATSILVKLLMDQLLKQVFDKYEEEEGVTMEEAAWTFVEMSAKAARLINGYNDLSHMMAAKSAIIMCVASLPDEVSSSTAIREVLPGLIDSLDAYIAMEGERIKKVELCKNADTTSN